MSKLLSALIAAVFAAVSVNVLAADAPKAEKAEAKTEMKAEKAEAKTEEKETKKETASAAAES